VIDMTTDIEALELLPPETPTTVIDWCQTCTCTWDTALTTMTVARN
jgi:hypothetical protein